jgi:formylglycine-generating enzyme required for sulfatase activity
VTTSLAIRRSRGALAGRRLRLVALAASAWALGLAGGCTSAPPPSPSEILGDLGRWDVADGDAHRAAAEDVARRLPDFALLRLETFSCGGQTHEVAIYAHAGTGLEFALVPGGTFLMGSPPDEPHRNAANETQHRVTLSPFLIARTEMTQGAWKRIAVDWNAEEELDESERGERRPVAHVTWSEVTAALLRADLSLPTEAQWEFACRAGSGTAFFTGPTSDTLIGFANLGREWREGAWSARPGLPDNSLYAEFPDGFISVAPVASFRPNAFGLHDMIGNVAEWCADGTVVLINQDGPDTVYREDYRPDPARDPLRAPGEDPDRIIRGGWWWAEAGWQGRSAHRNSNVENSCEAEIGFRPAKAVPTR